LILCIFGVLVFCAKGLTAQPAGSPAGGMAGSRQAVIPLGVAQD